MTMVTEYTVKAYARREQVNERTVRRWIEKGAVVVRRTPGGGVRIIEESSSRAVFFCDIRRQSRATLPVAPYFLSR